MSVPFSIGADIAEVDGGAGAGRIGVFSSSGRLPPSAALVRAMRFSVAGARCCPTGMTTLRVADGGDGFVGRDAVWLELVGVERDDDGALVAAEGRRGGNAGQGGEQRTHAVEREILHLALGAGRRC